MDSEARPTLAYIIDGYMMMMTFTHTNMIDQGVLDEQSETTLSLNMYAMNLKKSQKT
jgi:hypothetical protein